MKKTTVLLLCAALLMMLLSACGGDVAPTAGTEENPESGAKDSVAEIEISSDSAVAKPADSDEEAPDLTVGITIPAQPPLEPMESDSATADDSLIVLLYDETGFFEGDLPYTYRVPQLNLSGADAARINAKIKETYSAEVEEGLTAAKDGYSVFCYRIDYEVVWSSESVFALIVSAEYPNDCIYYSVYNFDISSGKALSNADLLDIAGLSETEFLRLAKERAVQVFEEKYAETPMEIVGQDFYDMQRDFSASDENIHPDMMMFLDKEGRLMLISAIGSLAGADSYEEVYPLIAE